MKDVKKRFTGIDDILQGGAIAVPSGNGKKEQAKAEVFRTSLELPQSLYVKVKKYAIDMGIKDKQAMFLIVQDFFERLENK